MAVRRLCRLVLLFALVLGLSWTAFWSLTRLCVLKVNTALAPSQGSPHGRLGARGNEQTAPLYLGRINVRSANVPKVNTPRPKPPTATGDIQRVLKRGMVALAAVAAAYVTASVSADLLLRDAFSGPGPAADAPVDQQGASRCQREVAEVLETLTQHLRNFRHVMDGYKPDHIQAWQEQASEWTQRWRVVGTRCRFNGKRGPKTANRKLQRELDVLATVHAEMARLRQETTKKLLVIGRKQAPRFRELERRLAAVEENLAETAP